MHGKEECLMAKTELIEAASVCMPDINWMRLLTQPTLHVQSITTAGN